MPGILNISELIDRDYIISAYEQVYDKYIIFAVDSDNNYTVTFYGNNKLANMYDMFYNYAFVSMIIKNSEVKIEVKFNIEKFESM